MSYSKSRLRRWLGIDGNEDGTFNAEDISISTTSWTGILAASDDDLQDALDTIDAVTGSEITIDTSNFELNYMGDNAQEVIAEIDNYLQDIQADAGLVKVQGGDLLENLGTKIIAGTGITLTTVTPTAVTMTDEQYANYGAFAAGESITTGERFRLTTADIDTADDYFASAKGSTLVANDIFEDVGGIGANYVTTQANTYQVKIDNSLLPIKVPNVVLDKDNWTVGTTYKEYEYTHNSVTSASWVDMVVHNSSSAIAEAAVMMPQVDEGTGTITIYAVNVPSDDITVDFKITLCDVES